MEQQSSIKQNLVDTKIKLKDGIQTQWTEQFNLACEKKMTFFPWDTFVYELSIISIEHVYY